MNITSGGSIFLSLLKDEGVSHLFGNPGTTELPIMHAMREHQDLSYVLGLQESLVVAMADGFSRASGKLTACNVHVDQVSAMPLDQFTMQVSLAHR